MFSAAAEAQTHHRRVVKLRFLSSRSEYLDLFVGNRIIYASESCFSRKVMSEVSVSQRRRNPSARSALPLTRTLSRPWGSVTDAVEKARRIGLVAYAHFHPSMRLCHRLSREGSKDRFDRRASEREDLFGPRNHLSERELLIAEGDE